MKIKKLAFLLVLLLVITNIYQPLTVVYAEDNSVIEVEVPAIWHPIDNETNEVIDWLYPKRTYPNMFDRVEIARKNNKGVHEITLMGEPKPVHNTASGNNFMYTSNLWFTDKFHRIVAQAYGTYDIDGYQSPIKKVTYGEFTMESSVFNSTMLGLSGFDKAPYQAGETMHLYVAVKPDPVSLSTPTYNDGDVVVHNKMDSAEIKSALLDHVDKVTYPYFGEGLMEYIPDKELDLTSLDKLFIWNYSSGDEGAFITEDGSYKNFINSLADLPSGTYEAVFPIYWQENIPDYLSAPDTFSRNRYKFDDTFHFTFTKESIIDVRVTTVWEDENNKDGVRPDSVTIKLLKGGVDTGQLLTLSVAENWTDSFLDLDEYKEGQKIDYTVEESEVGNGYTSAITGDVDTGYIVTYTYKPIVINPELEVEKMVEESSFSEAGDELHYSFEVTNTGNLAFTKLTVNDPRLGIADLVIDLTDPLLPGDSYIHEFTVPYVVTEEDVEAAAPIINTLIVVGETEEGFEDEDEDDVIVPFEQIDQIIPPILEVEMHAREKSFARAGDLIHYYFELTNEGIVPIVKLTVNDPKLGIVNLVIDLADDPLMPGDTLTYEFAEAYVVTEADVAAGKVENILTVIGESPDGAEDEVTDDLLVAMEKILPHLPETGEYTTYWYGLSTLLGGALLLVLFNRRRQYKR